MKKKSKNSNSSNNKVEKSNSITTTDINTSNERNIEFDNEGKEICFLFRKYGKCRYGAKCNRSHNINNTTSSVNLNNTEIQQQSLSQRIITIFKICDEECFKTIIPIERDMIKCGLRMKRNKKITFPPTSTSKLLLPKNHLKRIKQHHWKLSNLIAENLSSYPMIYSKTIVNRNETINISRVRPFLFLLLKSILNLDVENKWLISIGNTILSHLSSKVNGSYYTPIQIEKLLIDWGITDINARKLVVILWKNLLTSSTSNSKISQTILKCEREIRNNQIGSIDYAKSILSSSNFTKYSTESLNKLNNQTTKITTTTNNQQQLNWKDKKRLELNEFINKKEIKIII